MTLQEQRDIIQAAIDGKRLQFRASAKENWEEFIPEFSLFNFSRCQYRVKPEPREWWLTPADTADGFIVRNDLSEPLPPNVGARGKPIRVREVLD